MGCLVFSNKVLSRAGLKDCIEPKQVSLDKGTSADKIEPEPSSPSFKFSGNFIRYHLFKKSNFHSSVGAFYSEFELKNEIFLPLDKFLSEFNCTGLEEKNIFPEIFEFFFGEFRTIRVNHEILIKNIFSSLKAAYRACSLAVES